VPDAQDNTERPVTVEMGSNQLVGADPKRILEAYSNVMSGRLRKPQTPPLWDGKAAERIVSIIEQEI